MIEDSWKKKYFKNADRRAYPYVKQVDPGRSLLKGLRQRYHAVTFIYDNDKNIKVSLQCFS